MKILAYKHSSNIKRFLLFLAVVLVITLLTYTQSIVNKLRDESTNLISFYADVYMKAVTDYESNDFSFIFDEIIRKVSLPMIITQKIDAEPSAWRGVEIASQSATPADTLKLMKMVQEMDQANEPITLTYGELVLGYIHYGDTEMIRHLTYLPYIGISVAALFILIGYIGFQIIRSSEKNSIWVGMAKETAHQLGTPLSSLMGWTEVLKSLYEKDENLPEMEKDIRRLEKITHRFSKIGSVPSLEKQEINPVIEEAIEYYTRRLPQLKARVRLKFEPEGNYKANINAYLFSWAIENLIKNSIDAAPEEDGEVTVRASLVKQYQQLAIDVIDNGKGVLRRNWKNIFRPGYSTKKRGWGLGLSLATRIVKEYHKGKIFVLESKAFHKTVIRITIPVKNGDN